LSHGAVGGLQQIRAAIVKLGSLALYDDERNESS